MRMLATLRKLLGRFLPRKKFAGSTRYWEGRYKDGGHSGGGSYGRLARYKADFLNAFILRENIQSAVEWGCGDGHQASLLEVDTYVGLDVSPTAIDMCRKKMGDDSSKQFILVDKYLPGQKADLALSLDVIYHLVEDPIFENYMQSLFSSASRFVIIYSCDFDAPPTANHVRPRKFTDFVSRKFPSWKLTYTEENPFPMTTMNDPETSWSHFFVFRKEGF